MYAALYSKPEMVKFLLEEGADPSLQDNDGLNSLHFASEGGDPEVMEHLLCHVADGKSTTGNDSFGLCTGSPKVLLVKLIYKQQRSIMEDTSYCKKGKNTSQDKQGGIQLKVCRLCLTIFRFLNTIWTRNILLR